MINYSQVYIKYSVFLLYWIEETDENAYEFNIRLETFIV